MLDELLLYLIHGTLHLVGYDDASATQRAAMREKELHYLTQLGRCPHDAEEDSSAHISRVTGLLAEGEKQS